MNLRMSGDDLFWSLLSDEGGEYEYAKRDCDERLNPNVYKTGIDLTVSSTLKKPSKNYTCFISRRFGLFLIHLQSENKAFIF